MKTCYECEKPAVELSQRSRCMSCEHRRAVFNENENEGLRDRVAQLKHECDVMYLLLNEVWSSDNKPLDVVLRDLLYKDEQL